MRDRLRHVRWILGGTGAGGSTVARLLAERHGATVYDGDRAEHDWVRRCTPREHPYFHAGLQLSLERRALCAPADAVAAMAGLHGETIRLLVDDLLALPADRPVLVDYFSCTPRDVAALLNDPCHAVFLLPTEAFRRHNLGARYADPDRARANWGDADPRRALANRLDRDTLWDAELRAQATETGLPVYIVDGSVTPAGLADDLAGRFGLRG